MSKIKDDIKKAEYLIDTPSFYRTDKNIFDMIYPFTTENINGMFSHFNFIIGKSYLNLGYKQMCVLYSV